MLKIKNKQKPKNNKNKKSTSRKKKLFDNGPCLKTQKELCGDDKCTVCDDRRFANHPRAISWSSENIANILDITRRSRQSYKFDCDVCFHVFQMRIDKITIRNSWCTFCSHNTLCDSEACNMCKTNSFASHPKVDFWVDDANPRLIFRGSANKYKFKCDKCNHIFSQSLGNITNCDAWCPYCAHSILCDNQDCKMCEDNSFATNPRVKNWSPTNILTPRQIFSCTNEKYEFKCDDCKHMFMVTISNITKHNTWCSYCSHNELCSDLQCIMCFENSFASCERSQYWSNLNNVNPRFIFKYTHELYKFNCPDCPNIYVQSPKLIAGKEKCWCLCSSNTTENILYKYLIKTYPSLHIITQKRFNWCKNLRELRFDYLIEEYKIIIELDGLQHFKQVSTWTSPEITQQNDKYKMTCVLKNGYSIIRIFQPDVRQNTNNWQVNLNDAIIKLSSVKIPSHIFIGDIYNTYPKLDI
jgi:very-short-patch-repair endonuclease